MSRSGLRIVVAGTIASAPGHGGWTWVVLQYVLGLRGLGHQVLLVDPLAPARRRPSGPLAASENAAYFRAVVGRFDLEPDAVLLAADDTHETVGPPYGAILDAAARADLLINVSGVLRDEAVLGAARRRVYLDLDPAFTQLWHEAEGIDMGFASHTDFATIGLAIGDPACPVPTCGLPWIATPQPIVLDHWPAVDGCPDGPLTTVANWRGYGSVRHNGHVYGQKAHAFRDVMGLPRLTAERFVLALGIHPGETRDLEALADNGWALVDPRRVAGDPDRYQAFVQGSKGELGVAKTGYALSRCGWVSDRSLCYLASGRPVIAQDTGFGRFVPAEAGLLGFASLDEARERVEQVRLDYARQARLARAVAEEHFEAGAVLGRLLDRLGATS